MACRVPRLDQRGSGAKLLVLEARGTTLRRCCIPRTALPCRHASATSSVGAAAKMMATSTGCSCASKLVVRPALSCRALSTLSSSSSGSCPPSLVSFTPCRLCCSFAAASLLRASDEGSSPTSCLMSSTMLKQDGQERQKWVSEDLLELGSRARTHTLMSCLLYSSTITH